MSKVKSVIQNAYINGTLNSTVISIAEYGTLYEKCVFSGVVIQSQIDFNDSFEQCVFIDCEITTAGDEKRFLDNVFKNCTINGKKVEVYANDCLTGDMT